MRAWQVQRFGAPRDGMTLADAPEPEPGPGQIVVRVLAAPGLNHALIKNYSIVGLHWGLYGTKEPKALRDCHEELLKLAADGAIRPLVTERRGLADVVDGLERLAGGSVIGRLTFQP